MAASRNSQWIDSESEEDDYLLDSSSPTSMSLSFSRPRAPTLSSPIEDPDKNWSPRPDSNFAHSDSFVSLNSPISPVSAQSYHSPLLRSASEGEDNVAQSRAFSRPSRSMHLPDPSQFPDPYPFRPPHHHLISMPGLSSAESSSASTRSSAYASSSAIMSGDYGHVHVVSGDDEGLAGAGIATGITTDAVVQLLARDALSSGPGMHSRAPIDHSRWSESYSAGVRSRSSSMGNSISNQSHDPMPPRLHEKQSYDMGWQAVDERDEVGLSEEETDDDNVVDDYDNDDAEEERTTAVVLAEEGRGLIVHGEGLSINQLQVLPGTTHLLIGSSATPNAMHSYLTGTIPQICLSLLALDISANFLGALPPTLALCTNLEELNIASNPLRVLPVFLADLTGLCVLIADSTGISTLPDTLADLDKLHTVSVRRNKMHALPSWLCLLPNLLFLYVDGNPFQGPWKALVEPLLAKAPMTPAYPPSTPMLPMSAGLDTETDYTDPEDMSDPPSASPSGQFPLSAEEEEYTITPERAPIVGRPGVNSYPRPLTRTLTTPNRRPQPNNLTRAPSATVSSPRPNPPRPESGYLGDHEIRKMKSAGDLRRAKASNTASAPEGGLSRPPLSHYATSLSSSNLLNMESPSPERPGAKRFASVGPSTMMGSPTRNGSRPALTRSLWDGASENGDESPQSKMSFMPEHSNHNSRRDDITDGKATVRSRHTKESKEKGSRWGFLKKMSMGKMKADPPPPRFTTAPTIPGSMSRTTLSSDSSSSDRPEQRLPQISMRISTTGNLDAFPSSPPSISTPPVSSPNIEIHRELRPKPQAEGLSVLTTGSKNLLAPPSPTPRSAKRRSFLPIDSPFQLNIPIPETSSFVTGIMATNGDDNEARGAPSPAFEHEQYLRREEERAREGYSRALRSVMAYLKDMNDLGVPQQPSAVTAYGTGEDGLRSRRPTLVEGHREGSMVGTLSSADSPSQLRPTDSIVGFRSGASNQTMSVMTTDSGGSSEERKFKDDKGKRAMVLKEIVLTERTYVKGLQELVDIYIKPGCLPVNILSGSSKDTVIPPSERRIVFGGVDGLFSFHNDNFLPALEAAVAPLMDPSKDLDADGQLSLSVAKDVGNIFLKHAAFMKMYSSYINNFDNSIQRVKHWTSSRSTTGNASPGGALSPSSSTAQLAGLALSMSAISSPGTGQDNSSATGIPNLTTGQRKRIRSFLKRCRLSPRHSQLNLEGYLLLPVQRIPRYRLLLEELLRSTPPSYDYLDDPLERALAEISLLANNMNEGKRDAESRRKLVQWQARIRGKFPSPLVQPHRRLIMDGPLLLTRVVRKAMVSFEAINGQGDSSTVQVDCLAPELTPRPLMGVLCNDLLVLCRDPSEGQDPASFVDLWAVLRMQTLPQPASIVHGNALRLVDNKAILYFDAPSPSDALNWFRAINLHIPASKT
ncbi:hypothetical protein C8J56DRAFT_919557 [Mycena floridula]|nr:hypothetical protein C8J56DRAFT_919557 [Mycena floridula]